MADRDENNENMVIVDDDGEFDDDEDGEEVQEGQGQGNNELVVNALTLLRAPRKSDLARKRKVNVNPPRVDSMYTLPKISGVELYRRRRIGVTSPFVTMLAHQRLSVLA